MVSYRRAATGHSGLQSVVNDCERDSGQRSYFAQPIDRYFVKNYYFFERHAADWGGLIASLQNVGGRIPRRIPRTSVSTSCTTTAGTPSDVVIDFYSSKYA